MRKIIIFLVLLIFFAPSALSAIPNDLKEYCPEITAGDLPIGCEGLDNEAKNIYETLALSGKNACEEYLRCYNDPATLKSLGDLIGLMALERKAKRCYSACGEPSGFRDDDWNSCVAPCATYDEQKDAYVSERGGTPVMPGYESDCVDSLIAIECCPESSRLISNCGASKPAAPAAPTQAEICDNLLDDDGDRLADCADPDCAADQNCGFKVSGSVVTGGNKPLAGVKIALMGRSNSEIVIGYTDDYGAFTLDYSSKAAALGLPAQPVAAHLRVSLEDKDGLFKIVWDLQRANSGYTTDTQEFPLPTGQRFDIVLKSGIDLLAEDNKMASNFWDSHWDAGNAYYEAKRFFDFARTKLGYGFGGGGNPLPVNIFIYTSEDTSAFYDPGTRGGGIFLPPWKSSHNNPMCPENCVWHELFHFTMYNKYGAWAPGNSPYANHAGFKNNNTGDSYEEAFAEFWPNILALELNGDTAHIYADTWNMELNYNPWANEGKCEEFAMATLFWDLVDSNQDKGETLSVPYKDLWDVLIGQRLQSFKEVYDALKAKWPEKSDEINKLFVAHGIFKSTYPGNGQYDQGEPYWEKDPDGNGPLNPNGVRDPNEAYVDIGTPDDGIGRPHQVYTPGEEIGTASNYNRTTREDKPLEKGSFVNVGVTSNGAAANDAVFKVSYSFSDPSLNYASYGVVDEETGYVYVEIPPEEYQMTASITADNYEGGQPVTVSANEYYASKASGAGVIKSAGISAGGKKANYCNNDGTCQNGESQNCGDCWSNSPPGGRPGAASDSSVIGIIFIVVVIGAAAFVYAKKRKPVAKPVKQIAVKSEFCQKCGTAVPPESAFCPSCGGKVKKS